jgi:predicted small lipoprotein YifL
MIPRIVKLGMVCSCLLLMLSACGNKGPLVPAGEEEEEQQKQEQQKTETGAE